MSKTTNEEHRQQMSELQRQYDEHCKAVPWFIRILFPDVVLPTVTVAIVAVLIIWAILRSKQS